MPARQDHVKTADQTTPEEFGPYVVYERLGVGGMATVHRAKKRGIAGFERGVALKRMLPHLAEDAEFINSFVREAKLASLLVHPNIAQIYDFGRVGSVYFIAMEHVDGFDVRKMLRYSNRHKEPLPLNVVMSILCELCDALEYAHTFVDEHGQPQGIVHRDVSPSNLIVAQSGHLKVIDFGIAKANVRQLHTESGRVKGKLGYMSPEAVTGRAFGPVSDVFSAGVVAHELLTAHPLFSAKTDYDTLIRIHEAEIPPPSRRNPGVPQALDEVVLAALARDPDRRLQTAGAFREALEYVAEQAGVRFSARDVAEWRAKIATTEDPWGSRTSLPNVSSSQVSRAFPFPESRSHSGIAARPTEIAPRPSQPVRAMTSAEPDEDKAVADLTWGNDGEKSSTLHPVPDQALAAPAHAHTPAPAPALPPPMIGASIQSRAPAQGKSSLARAALVVLFAIAAALAVYQFVLRGKKPAPVAPAAPVATLKFIVQPTDSIVEIGGKQAGDSSPFETKLEPGVYSIAVKHAGFKPWTGQATLRDGDAQTVRVALEAGMAHLSVTSLPAGLVAELDGKKLDQVTPIDMQTTAGAHKLVVTNAVGAQWTQDFTAEIDGKYTFHAPLDKAKKPPTPAAATTPPPQITRTPDRAPERTPDRVPERTPDRTPERTPKRPAVVTETKPEPPEIKPEPPVVHDAGVPQVVQPKVPEVKPQPAGPKTTPTVSPAAVSKLSGSVPALKVSGSEDQADVLTKICIDEAGHVTSVKVIRGLPEINDELQRAMMAWRYKPYTNPAGQTSPACFALQQRLVFKRGN
jgi:serine/threonine-protein kinase